MDNNDTEDRPSLGVLNLDRMLVFTKVKAWGPCPAGRDQTRDLTCRALSCISAEALPDLKAACACQLGMNACILLSMGLLGQCLAHVKWLQKGHGCHWACFCLGGSSRP